MSKLFMGLKFEKSFPKWVLVACAVDIIVACSGAAILVIKTIKGPFTRAIRRIIYCCFHETMRPTGC